MIREVESVIPESFRGERLSRFLREMLPHLPSRSIRYAAGKGNVLVNGAPAPMGRILESGDRVRVVEAPEEDDWLPAPGVVPGASILYRDRHLVVLDKPPNVHTEPHSPGERGTLAGYMLHMFPEVLQVTRAPGLTLVTRLDYVTSGAVPAAITAVGASHLMHEREQGRIRKRYACVVEGTVDQEMVLTDRIDSRGGERVRVARGGGDPDPDRWTRVTPISPPSAGRTLVTAEIQRGKRHQIRAHLASAGHPIVGDRTYGTVPPGGEGEDRLLLHAREVSFALVGGGEVSVVSPLPSLFLAAARNST